MHVPYTDHHVSGHQKMSQTASIHMAQACDPKRIFHTFLYEPHYEFLIQLNTITCILSIG